MFKPKNNDCYQTSLLKNSPCLICNWLGKQKALFQTLFSAFLQFKASSTSKQQNWSIS